jgi:hypothetical protein
MSFAPVLWNGQPVDIVAAQIFGSPETMWCDDLGAPPLKTTAAFSFLRKAVPSDLGENVEVKLERSPRSPNGPEFLPKSPGYWTMTLTGHTYRNGNLIVVEASDIGIIISEEGPREVEKAWAKQRGAE